MDNSEATQNLYDYMDSLIDDDEPDHLMDMVDGLFRLNVAVIPQAEVDAHFKK